MKSTMYFFGIGALIIAGCSYDNGVFRTLSFETEITDFSCFSQTLETLGYETRPIEHGVEYQNADGSVYAAFSQAQISDENGFRYQTDIITHSSGFTSGPLKCRDARAVNETLMQIETKIFAACQLKPAVLDETLRCG